MEESDSYDIETTLNATIDTYWFAFWTNKTGWKDIFVRGGEGPDACDWFLFLVPGLLAAVTIIFGLIGNTFSLAVIWRIGRGSLTFRLVAILSVMDFMFLFCYLMSKSIPDIINFLYFSHSTQLYFLYTKYLLYPLVAMCSTASTWITVLITTYRYMIARKIVRRSRVCGATSINLQVAIILVCAFLLDLPKYFEFQPVLCDECKNIALVPTDLWKNSLYHLIYRNIISLVVRRVIPIIITIVMVYKRVQLLESWRLSRLRKFNKYRLPDCQDRITRVLIIMAIVYITCHIPSLIYPIFRSIFKITTISCEESWFIYFGYAADYLVVFNSSITFYLFYLFLPQYRKTVRQMLCGPEKRSRRGPSVEALCSYTADSPDPARDERVRTISTFWIISILMHCCFELKLSYEYTSIGVCNYRADSRFAPSQWDTALLCNDVSHLLGASLESALTYHIANFMGPSWSCRGNYTSQVGSTLIPWTLLSRQLAVISEAPCTNMD